MTLSTLVSFPLIYPNSTTPSGPAGSLMMDANGDLFGTTSGGGTNQVGTIFEIVKTATGYANTATVLANFSQSTGTVPLGSLIMDANGDLFGTTSGEPDGNGTVFELVKTATGYASSPVVLTSFNGGNGSVPLGSLIMDATGDLFGTTSTGGVLNGGTVFEIVKTAGGYASTPITLVSFDTQNYPEGSLIADSKGNLFGTTVGGGANGLGSVFEIVKTAAGYANTQTLLASFVPTTGIFPDGTLIMDADGNLFGTTSEGGSGAGGTVFEIVKTANGYASTPTILATFDNTSGYVPRGDLVMDAAGDLFGTASKGGTGSSGQLASGGTVFEIVKTPTGYDSTPRAVVNFNDANGYHPVGGLTVDSQGNLFGSTRGSGVESDGTVFELSGSGFYTSLPAATALTFWQSGQLSSPAKISDTAAAIQADLDSLQGMATSGLLSSIALTDSGTPNITLSATQFTTDAAVLKDITSGHSVTMQMSGNAASHSFTGENWAGATDLKFSDQTVFVAATPGPANAVTTGNVTELYSAVLAREPDVGGAAFYQNFLKANPNTSLQTFATFFLNSGEYTSNSAHNYAQTTAGETQFILDSYQNLLHRTPSASEINFYLTNVLEQPGTQQQNHALMLVYFSASSEFLGDVQITASTPASAQHWLILT